MGAVRAHTIYYKQTCAKNKTFTGFFSFWSMRVYKFYVFSEKSETSGTKRYGRKRKTKIYCLLSRRKCGILLPWLNLCGREVQYSLRTRFLEELTKTAMAERIQQAGGVLVAYSGGADSTLLLHFLHSYCQDHELALYAAHIHHGIRGDEADRDEAHCVQTAKALNIPLYVYHRNIPALAKERSMGLEECARLERYACLDEACVTIGKSDLPIATAHNGDDQLETILFHLLRGSGLTGMCGIAPIRDGRYIRPLLSFSSAEIRQTCREEGYAYVEDSTNTDTAYSRNYLRHEIIPRLRHLTPHPEVAACTMAALLTQDQDYLQKEAQNALQDCTIPGTDCIDRHALCQLHPALSTRVLRLATEKHGSSMTKEQTDNLLAMAKMPDREERQLSLPGKIQAVVKADCICFTKEELYSVAPLPSLDVPTVAPGETIILDWKTQKIVLSRKNLPTRPENLENIYNLSIQRPMNFATIKGVLCLRTRKPGDTIRYGGMSRKVRKLQNAYHTPPEERETMLVLCDAEEILWVEGWQVCDKAKCDENTEDILWIEMYEN